MLNNRHCVLVLLGAGLLAPPVAAQSGTDVFERMRQAYEQRMAGIRNYTIVQETMGVETVSYFEREMVDGHPIFRLRRTGVNGVTTTSSDDDDEAGWDELYVLAADFSEHAKYLRQEKIDGIGVHVVQVNDLAELGVGPGSPDNEIQFEAERALFYVDGDDWVVRRLVFEGTTATDAGSANVSMTLDFRDFRDVEGMLHPFVTAMSFVGDETAMGMSDDQIAEMREQIKEMKARLAEMPETQRKMMEGMMKNQMEQFENMLQGDGGMTFEIKVTEIRVNTGG